MSTTVDNRVLEMRFDNKQFESGVATSMSTLEKLKQKLNLSGAAKGLEGINKAAKNIDFSHLSAGADAVSVKFSHMQMSIQHQLNKIVDSCVAAGKRMVDAFTIDPVKTGFQEYETQINAVQTILANTESKGTTLDQVNAALDELNHYADKTIYNFTEMTRNIGTFTAAGVDLKTSVSAIQGIANLAAISGSTSQQASTAMYQLSQALSTGTVRLMDWNSVVNAGMGGEVFRSALEKTSELLGTGAKAAIEAKGSFRESLQTGWLTSEVLTQTLQKMTTSGANEYVAEYTGLTVEAVEASLEDAKAKYGEADAIKEASKALAEKSGKSADEIEETLQMAKTAEEAATKVKTFTQLMDTLKEAVQSGWTQTWEILVGDFEEAKELFTDISDTLSEFINKSAESRNSVLEGAMTSNWDKLIEKVNEAGVDTDTFNEKVKAIAEDGGVNVDKLIAKYGSLEKAFQNGAISSNILTKALKEISGAATELEGIFRIGDGMSEASDDVKKLQTALEKAGFTLEQFGVDGKFGKETEDAVRAFQEAKGLAADGIVGPETLAALKEASGVTGKLAADVLELAKNVDQIGGRQHIIDGFKNAFSALTSIFGAVGDAWENIFPAGTIEERSEKVLGLTEAFHNFTENLLPTEEMLNNVTRTFSGLFAILDIIRTITGGGLSIGFKVLSALFGIFDTSILEVTANIGDACVAFRDFLFSGKAISKAIDELIDKLPGAITRFKEWFNTFKETPVVQKFLDSIEKIKEAFSKFSLGEINVTELARSLGTNIANALMTIPDIVVQIGRDVIAGFQNGIKEGISGSIIGDIISFCTEFIAAFAAALGCHSPSVKTEEIGKNTIEGFVIGIREALAPVLDTIEFIGKQIINAFKFIWDLVTDESGNLEWDKVFAGSMLISGLLIVKQFIDAMKGIADGIGGIGNILESAGKSLKGFTKVLNSYAWDLKAKAIQKMAVSIAILAGVIWAIAQIDDPSKLWTAVGVVGALAAIVLALAGAMELMSKSSLTYEKGKLNIEGLKASILQIGATLLMLGVVVKMIGDMTPDQAKQGFIGLTGMMVEVIAFMAVVGLLVKGKAVENIDKVGKLMTKLAFAMILMTAVVKLSSGLSGEEMLKGAAFAAAFGVFVVAITNVAKSAGNNVSKAGGMILKITMAMMLMISVVKLIDLLNPDEMLKGAAFASAFVVFINVLVKATKIGKKQEIAKLGGLLMSISFSMLLMVGVCKLVGILSVGDMVKGTAFVGAFLVFLNLLIKISSNNGEIIKVGGTILAVSVAIGILAGVAALLGALDTGGLIKGISAVGALSIFMAMMVKAMKGVNATKDMSSSLMKLVIAIGAMALAVTALSLIDTTDLAAATVALGSLMGMFALMSKSMSGLSGIKAGPLIGMILVIGSLSAIIYALSILNVGSTIEIVSSIGLLMLSLGTTMKLINGIGSDILKALPTMVLLGVLAGLIGLMLTGLTKLNPGPTLEIATSLSEVLLAMSGAALILSKIGPLAAPGVAGAAAFLGLVLAAGAILGVIGGLVAKCDKAQEFLDSGIPIMESIGKALGSLIGGIIGGIGEGVSNSLPAMIENVKKFMDGLAEVADKGSTIKAGSFDGVVSLSKAMMDIAIGSLVEKFASGLMGESSLEAFSKNAITFVKTMSSISMILTVFPINDEAISKVAKCGTLFSKLANSLPKSGGLLQNIIGEEDLAGFGDKVKSFVKEMLKVNEAVSEEGFTINEDAISAIATAGNKFSELVNSLPKSGSFIAKNVLGEQDLAGFGTAVTAFVGELKTVNASLGEDFTFNETAINSLITAGNKFVELQAALPRTGGWDDTIMGSDDLGTFGETVGAFAEALGTIKEKLGDDGLTESTITSITNAGNALVALQEALPSEKWFDGKINLEEFSGYIGTFSTAISDFSTKASELDSAGIATAMSAAYNIKYLIEAIAGIDYSGIADFTGIGKGDRGADGPMHDIAVAINDFSTVVSEIDIAALTASITAATTLRNFIVNLQGLDPSGIENFKIDSIGAAMKKYGSDVSGIDTSVVASSISSANRLKTFIASLAGLDNSGVANFKPGSIGTSLKSYSATVVGIDLGAISNSVAAANKIKELISGLAGLDASGVSSFVSSINTLGSASMKGLTEAFSGSSGDMSSVGSDLFGSLAKGMKSGQSSITGAASSVMNAAQKTIMSSVSAFTRAGSTLMMSLADGLNSRRANVSSAVTSALSSAAGRIASYHGSFYSNGGYLGDGLVSGINSRQSAAYQAGYALGQAAVQGEKDGQASNSPSKLTIQAGEWLGDGLVIGIKKMGKKVYNVGHNLGNTATRSISGAISKVSDLINTGIDPNPTISPVVDLSNVQSSVGAISGMFTDATSSIGVMSNLNAINATMNRRNQNGSMNDVVDAINKMRKDIGDKTLGNTTYSIGGVTYDNGSEVSEAIGALVRALRIEGRA